VIVVMTCKFVIKLINNLNSVFSGITRHNMKAYECIKNVTSQNINS
jgi:hypothetical protein